eukprot:4872506-Amphidinium_carterae.1
MPFNVFGDVLYNIVMAISQELPHIIEQATLILRKLNGEELVVLCSTEELIADVKRKVRDKYQVAENLQILLSSGTFLKDHMSL